MKRVVTAETEGVIKYALDFTPSGPLDPELCAELSGWHRLLQSLGMVGRNPGRYGGLGFGNLSHRLPDGDAFVITGTQTGGLDALTPAHFSLVTRFDVTSNTLSARGPVRPSSEALSHGAVYAARLDASFVFHCHHPLPWHAGTRLGLAQTPAGVPYGTPAMARAMARLLAPPARLPCVVAMRGHEDGLIAAGATARETGGAMVDALARAMALT